MRRDCEKRTRLGVVLPSVNTVVEPWFNRVVPNGVSVHAARMLLADEISAEALTRMDAQEGARALRQLASCRPHAVAYCCTASSIVAGAGHDDDLMAGIRETCGVAGTTATRAILEALRVLECTRVIEVSPYTEEIDRAERRFLAAAGITVVAGGCMGIGDGFLLASPEPEEIRRLAHRHWQHDADAVLISCLNFRSHETIEALEKDFNMPVVTSTQAVLWRVLRLAGVTDRLDGCGRLLREH
jgi:maleate isomerase